MKIYTHKISANEIAYLAKDKNRVIARIIERPGYFAIRPMKNQPCLYFENMSDLFIYLYDKQNESSRSFAVLPMKECDIKKLLKSSV